MNASVIDLYEQLASAPDDKARARIIAQAFEALAERYPNLAEAATRTDLSETELRLAKEIEQVRLQTEQVRADLTKEIEQVRGEIKETELKLTREIEQVRADLTKEIERVRSELRQTAADLAVRIERSKAETVRWVAGLWLAQTALIAWLILRATG